jgi:ABC-type maltose transport system permease subunit
MRDFGGINFEASFCIDSSLSSKCITRIEHESNSLFIKLTRFIRDMHVYLVSEWPNSRENIKRRTPELSFYATIDMLTRILEMWCVQCHDAEQSSDKTRRW